MDEKEPMLMAHQGAAFIREDFDAATVLHVFGEIDISNSGQFESSVHEATDLDGSRLTIIDLTGCSFIDSTALQVLVRSHNNLGDRLCVVVPEESMLQRIFKITSLGDRFPMAESVGQVLK